MSLLKGMLRRDLFNKYSKTLFLIPNLEKEVKDLLVACSKYYKQYDDKESMTVDELRAHFFYLNPQLKDKAMVEATLDGLANAEIGNEDLLVTILNQVVEQHISSEIGQIAQEVVQEQRSTGIDDIRDLLSRYDEIVGAVDAIDNDVCDMPIRELFASVTGEGLTFRLPFLKETYGLLRPGTLGHIFARPDAGKTSLALQELTFFSSQLTEDRPGLYLNNEEGMNRIKARAMCACLKWTPEQIMSDYDRAESIWNKWNCDKLKFIGSITHISQVIEKLDRYNPRVVFIDQGPKVDIFGKAEGTARLQILYNQYRSLADKYNTSIITLGQADNAAENRKYLSLNNMDHSKVAIPGELDWSFGIGKVDAEGLEEVRFFSSCKNKLTGRYGRGEALFHIEKCRFE
jgi:hypothetical protein